LVTAGALGAGIDYQDLLFTDTAVTVSGVEVLQGIIKTDATPTDITVSLLSGAAADDFNLYYVWMYEMSENTPVEAPHIPMQTASYTSADDTVTGTGAGAWFGLSDLTLIQYVPYEGYRFTYECTLGFRPPAGDGSQDQIYYAFRIQRDDGAAVTVEGPYGWEGANNTNVQFYGSIMTLKNVFENPTPGLTYTYTVDVYIESTGNAVDTIDFNPTIGAGALATQSQSRLFTERI
jgi:hypothetical protein